jgi:hypothetical protein
MIVLLHGDPACYVSVLSIRLPNEFSFASSFSSNEASPSGPTHRSLVFEAIVASPHPAISPPPSPDPF